MMDDRPDEDHERDHDALVRELTVAADSRALSKDAQELARAWVRRLQTVRARAEAPLKVAFVAEVGCGKTALIAAATGLRLDGDDDKPKRWSVLPVGDGRTTLGETEICFGERTDIRLEVEPFTRAQLETELRLFVEDLWVKHRNERVSETGVEAGEELHILLRAWLVPEGDRRAILKSWVDEASDLSAFKDMLFSKIDLDERSRSWVQCFADTQDGLKDLKSILRALMKGKLADAPAPRRMRIELPNRDGAASMPTILDTRGVDPQFAKTIEARTDLQILLREPDTLFLVGSVFKAAPDAVSLAVLKELSSKRSAEDAGSMARLVIVDNRDPEEDETERQQQLQDREERLAQCRDRLRREGITMADSTVMAIDVRHETEALRTALTQMVEEARTPRKEVWQKTLGEAREATSILDEPTFARKRRKANLRLWWSWEQSTLSSKRPRAENGLLAVALWLEHGLEESLGAQLYATIQRRGDYAGFELAVMGGSVAPHLATKDILLALHGVLVWYSQHEDPRLLEYVGLQVRTVILALERYEARLRDSWISILSDFFSSSSADALFSWCEARWGQRSGYVKDVAKRFSEASVDYGPALSMDPRLPVFEAPLPPRPDMFRLHQIRLRNFRGIEQGEMAFDDRTTVLVGDNATGKTAWLEATAMVLGAFLSGLDVAGAPEFAKRDIRQIVQTIKGVPDRQPQLPMEVSVETTVDAVPLDWARSFRSAPAERASKEEDGLRIVAEQIGQEIRSHEERPLPVLAYYGTQRLWPADIEADNTRREVGSRLDGYIDALKAASTHQHMLSWMRQYTFAELQRKEPVVQLRAIQAAVVACIEEAKAFTYDVTLEDLVLMLHDGEVVPFRILSDGYRNMVAIVADIAWRAVVLNPQHGERAAELAEGVVLIDEIDLHLHPKWQRRVLGDLRRAFPRLQIIATTHSPFIIQSLEPGQLVNLDPGAEPAPYSHESPEDIAENVMGVELPQRSERRRREYEVAERYYALLEQMPDADETELVRLKDELDKLVAPYADNQAFVAFLEQKRILAEAKRA